MTEGQARPWTALQSAGLILGPAALAGWILFAPLGRLTPEAHRLAGVLALTIIWWLTEPIPIAATGLFAAALSVFVGAVPGEGPARTALAPFADPSVFFLLGGMFLARAMTRHGLDRRIALSVLCTPWAGRSPTSVLTALGAAVILVSMWVSNTAATAMVYPVTVGMIQVLAAGSGDQGRFERSRFATGLLLITAYASSIGGVATPIGTATNVVAMGFFRQPEFFGRSIDFFRWTLVGAPLTLLLGAGLVAWLRFLSPARELDLGSLRGYLRSEKARLGPLGRGESNTLLVFGVVVTLWLLPTFLAIVAGPEAQRAFLSRFPEEMVALLAPALLYLLPVDRRAGEFSLGVEDFRRIDWGTILLFGAGLSLGSLMFRTGLAEAVGRAAFDLLPTRDVWTITAVAIVGGIVLSEFTSNAATAATLIPVVFSLAKTAEIDPIPPLFGVTFAASFGSALPVSTPPNAIVYGSGWIPLRRMALAGFGLDLLSGAAVWLVLRVAYLFDWSPIPAG